MYARRQHRCYRVKPQQRCIHGLRFRDSSLLYLCFASNAEPKRNRGDVDDVDDVDDGDDDDGPRPWRCTTIRTKTKRGRRRSSTIVSAHRFLFKPHCQRYVQSATHCMSGSACLGEQARPKDGRPISCHGTASRPAGGVATWMGYLLHVA